MGGFYGNITNTSKTQFQFDKIYPSRYEMDKNALADGVYLGRHVLIEYDSEHHLDTFLRVYMKSGVAYRDASFESKYTKSDIDAGTLVYTTNSDLTPETGLKGDDCTFYKCTSNYVSGSSAAATFEQIEKFNGPNYTDNYHIDQAKYGSGRGYDSTVWQKVYSNGSEKYVMIAELNTVVPAFDIVADAPSVVPVAPHFDTQSTDVYYKLHVPTQWGFRVAAKKTSEGSDIKGSYTYYNTTSKTDVTQPDRDLAIYFNKAGFNEDTRTHVGDKENYIKLSAASSNKPQYDDHNITTNELVSDNDIQELSIQLPAIGNMMSDAWDIIHGPNRDNSMAEFELNEDGSKKLDKNGEPIRIDSLQGRLDSIAAIAGDEIPVKRHDNGQLIGSKINGGKADEDDKTGVNDDAWIETIVDAATNTISIHHKFNRTKNGNTFIDLREADDWGHDTIDSIDMNNEEDSFDIVTPIIDDMGHVVGENTQTVILPYGFKTIKTNGRSDEVAENATGTPATADVVADNTQDELTINSGNKWIRIDTNATNDTITIRHDVHNFDTDKADSASLSNETSEIVTFDTTTYDFDKAGHFTGKTIKTITVPFGYGKVKGDSGETAATATYDELTFASDEWLTATVATDKVIYSHDTANPNEIVYTDKENQYPSFGSTFTIEDWAFDEKGHQFNNNKSHTVTIPGVVLNNANDGNVVVGLALSKATENNNKTATFTESKVNVGNLALTDYSVVNHTNANGSTDLQPQDTINSAFNKLQTQIYEEEVARANETVRAQEAEKALGERIDALDYSETANDTQIITQITQTDGKITNIARAAAGTLVLGSGYTKPNDGGIIATTDSLNSAIGKLEKNIEIEKSRAESAETTLTINLDTKIAAVNNRITTLIGGENLNTAFDTLKEVADWLETNDSNADKVIDSIATLNGTVETTGSVAHSIKQAIDSEVNERNAAITTAINALPVYTLTSGSINGTVKFNNTDVAVTGLGSAAYTNSDSYASATILEDARFSFAPSDTEDPEFTTLSLSELFTLVANLQAQVNNLTQEIELLKNSNPTE